MGKTEKTERKEAIIALMVSANLETNDQIAQKNLLKCTICATTYQSESGLKLHIKSVHNEIRHQCKICGHQTTQSSSLNFHIRTIHQDIKHICKYCDKSFKQKSEVKNHIEKFHIAKVKQKFTCKFCNHEYASNKYLEGHIQALHTAEILILILGSVLTKNFRFLKVLIA